MRKKILLADTDPVSLVFISELLREQGYAVDVVRDAQECSEEVREGKPDILIIDEALPKLSLQELLRTSKVEEQNHIVPKVILLAQLGEPVGGAPLRVSPNVHSINKNCWSEELLKKLEEII